MEFLHIYPRRVVALTPVEHIVGVDVVENSSKSSNNWRRGQHAAERCRIVAYELYSFRLSSDIQSATNRRHIHAIQFVYEERDMKNSLQVRRTRVNAIKCSSSSSTSKNGSGGFRRDLVDWGQPCFSMTE